MCNTIIQQFFNPIENVFHRSILTNKHRFENLLDTWFEIVFKNPRRQKVTAERQ